MSLPFLRFLGGDVTHDQFDLPENKDRLTVWMRRNRDEHTPVFCFCRANAVAGPKLAVVLKDGYFLRRYNDSNDQHAEDCRFREAPKAASEVRYLPGVLREADGAMRLRLGDDVFPARQQAHAAAAENAEVPTPATGREGRKSSTVHGTISLLGLFRFLLDEAGANYWRPSFEGHRSAATLTKRLLDVTGRCSVARGLCLQDLIVWPVRPIEESELIMRLKETRMKRADENGEILLFGKVQSIRLSKSGRSMCIRMDWFRSTFLCHLDKWAEFERSHSRALTVDCDGNPRNLVFALVTVRLVAWPSMTLGKKSPLLVPYLSNIAPMMMSPQLIPVESGHELAFAAYLYRLRRTFAKPLRIQKEDEMLPDFVLKDTHSDTHCEVWGLDSPEYRTRRAAKIALCELENIALVEWDAAAGSPLPILPIQTSSFRASE